MMGYMMLLKDAAGELKDLGEQAEMAEEEAADLEGEDGNPDEDLDDATRAELEAAGLSFVRAPKAHERALFAPCLAVYRAAAAPLRSVYAHVLKSERACDLPSPQTPAPASMSEPISAAATAAASGAVAAASAAGAVSAKVDASAPELAEWRAYTHWLERVCDSFDGVSAAVDQVRCSVAFRNCISRAISLLRDIASAIPGVCHLNVCLNV